MHVNNPHYALDGFSEHMNNYKDEYTFTLADEKEPSGEDIIKTLKKSKTEVLLNYLSVGSEEATRFYAECSLGAGVAFINNIPVFIVGNPEWAQKFKEKNISIIGMM